MDEHAGIERSKRRKKRSIAFPLSVSLVSPKSKGRKQEEEEEEHGEEHEEEEEEHKRSKRRKKRKRSPPHEMTLDARKGFQPRTFSFNSCKKIYFTI